VTDCDVPKSLGRPYPPEHLDFQQFAWLDPLRDVVEAEVLNRTRSTERGPGSICQVKEIRKN
jgi:hypothetical protein